MATHNEHKRPSLAIRLDPDLANRVKAAATERQMSVSDYVVSVLYIAVDGNPIESELAEAKAWSQLSADSFARDWNSDADAVYDDLA